jgi:hypothetical protein
MQADLSNARPQSLARSIDTGELPDDESIGRVKHFLLRLGGFYSRESGLSRGALKAMCAACMVAATFSTSCRYL